MLSVLSVVSGLRTQYKLKKVEKKSWGKKNGHEVCEARTHIKSKLRHRDHLTILGRFLRGLFFEVTNRAFYAFKLVIAPQREEIEPALVGRSLTTLGEVPRPFSRFSVARISD